MLLWRRSVKRAERIEMRLCQDEDRLLAEDCHSVRTATASAATNRTTSTVWLCKRYPAAGNGSLMRRLRIAPEAASRSASRRSHRRFQALVPQDLGAATRATAPDATSPRRRSSNTRLPDTEPCEGGAYWGRLC